MTNLPQTDQRTNSENDTFEYICPHCNHKVTTNAVVYGYPTVCDHCGEQLWLFNKTNRTSATITRKSEQTKKAMLRSVIIVNFGLLLSAWASLLVCEKNSLASDILDALPFLENEIYFFIACFAYIFPVVRSLHKTRKCFREENEEYWKLIPFWIKDEFATKYTLEYGLKLFPIKAQTDVYHYDYSLVKKPLLIMLGEKPLDFEKESNFSPSVLIVLAGIFAFFAVAPFFFIILIPAALFCAYYLKAKKEHEEIMKKALQVAKMLPEQIVNKDSKKRLNSATLQRSVQKKKIFVRSESGAKQ